MTIPQRTARPGNLQNFQHSFAYPKESSMLIQMIFRFRILVSLMFLPLLTQCGTSPAPTTNAVTGPFDNRGNYVEDWADSPDKWYRPSSSSAKTKPRTVTATVEPERPSQIAQLEPRSAPVVAASKPNPVVSKPKPVVAKPKPKPKPKVVKYTVKKGDNLSRIAGKHGVSLSALRRANGISGDVIRPGQSLTIPK